MRRRPAASAGARTACGSGAAPARPAQPMLQISAPPGGSLLAGPATAVQPQCVAAAPHHEPFSGNRYIDNPTIISSPQTKSLSRDES